MVHHGVLDLYVCFLYRLWTVDESGEGQENLINFLPSHKNSHFISMSGIMKTHQRKQALRDSCELLRQRKEVHASLCNCMQVYVIACKLMDLQSQVAKLSAHV